MEGMNTTLYFLEKREESISFDVFLCFLGEKYGEKREKKNAKKHLNSSQKPTFSILVQYGVPRAIYSPWHAILGTNTWYETWKHVDLT